MRALLEPQLGVPWNHREDLRGVHQVALHVLQQKHRYETRFYYLLFLLNVLPAHKVLDEPDTAKVERPKPGERPKPRRTRQSPTRSTASSSAAKRKVKFDEDDAPESNVTTRISKRAKVSHDEDSLLSRAEAAGGHSVQISDSDINNIVTLYRLRRASGRSADVTWYMCYTGRPNDS